MANKLIPMHPAEGWPPKGEVVGDMPQAERDTFEYFQPRIKKGITVRCPNDHCRVEFGIEDPPGFIRAEEYEKLFERLYRIQSELEDLIMVANDLLPE